MRRSSAEAVLAHGYCDVSGRNRCTSDGELAELLRRHVVPNAVAENDINKFPHVPERGGDGGWDPVGLRQGSTGWHLRPKATSTPRSGSSPE